MNNIRFERALRATGNTADNAVENFIRLAKNERRWEIEGTVTLEHRSASDVNYDERWKATGTIVRTEIQ